MQVLLSNGFGFLKDSTKSEEETREKQMDKGSRSQVLPDLIISIIKQSSSWTCDDSDDTLQQAKQEDPFGR